jgi:hypothetical protein
MKLFKSLLLGSAAGLVVVSGASAADLGAKKPSPVEYVKACYNPLWGTTGGFVIPGTQTCLRISGRVRAQYGWNEQFTRASDKIGFRSQGVVNFDAITPSEYGNVRAFVSVDIATRTGLDRSGSGARYAASFNGTGADVRGSTAIGFNTAFIQFAGITAGRYSSFFDFGGSPGIIGVETFSSIGFTNGIAYTASLGNGFLATVSLEDPTYRRHGILSANVANAGVAGPIAAPTVIPMAGYAMPEIVGALRVQQSWGAAQLSGVIRENSTNLPGVSNTSKLGWAVSGGLKINLPMLAAGDAFWLTGSYGEGATNYVIGNWTGTPGGVGAAMSAGPGKITNAALAADAVLSPTGGISLVKAWSVVGTFQHFWTPTIRSGLGASYAQVDLPNSTAASRYRDWEVFTAFFNTFWSPVRGLDIGGEVSYVNVRVKGNGFTPNGAAVNKAFPAGSLTRSEDAWAFRFRIQRDF